MYKSIFRIILYFIPLFFFSANGFSQESFCAGAAVHYGYVIPHRESMNHLITAHTKGLEIDVFRQSTGKRSWEQTYLYPQIGVKFYYADLGNPRLLGFAAGAIPYIYFPVLRAKKFSVGIVLGTSYGYVSKRFDINEHHKNNAIGSHINGIMHGTVEAQYAVSSSVMIRGGIVLTHFSNGAYQMPNLGINIPTLSLGFVMALGKKFPDFIRNDTLPAVSHKPEFSITAAAGMKEVRSYGGDKYPTYTLSVYVLQPIMKKSKLGICANVFYNTALEYLMSDSAGDKVSPGKIVRIGISVPYVIQVSRLSIVFSFGMYVLDSYKLEGKIYDRVGIHYLISKHLLISHMLKIHGVRADNIEFGLGYKF